MPNGRPGNSRAHDLLHHGLPVFGPAIDPLVRKIGAHTAPEARGELITLIESWPLDADGTPRDAEALLARLAALRDGLAARPLRAGRGPNGAAHRPRLPPRRAGTPLAALIGLAVGGFAGLPLGVLGYLALREAVLPHHPLSSDAAMWTVIGAVALATAAAGALQGGRPSRAGHAVLIALLGFCVGSLVLGLVTGLLVIGISAAGVVQPEAGLARQVVFGVMPLAAMAGGAALAWWTGRRAWRDWLG